MKFWWMSCRIKWMPTPVTLCFYNIIWTTFYYGSKHWVGLIFIMHKSNNITMCTRHKATTRLQIVLFSPSTIWAKGNEVIFQMNLKLPIDISLLNILIRQYLVFAELCNIKSSTDINIWLIIILICTISKWFHLNWFHLNESFYVYYVFILLPYMKTSSIAIIET